MNFDFSEEEEAVQELAGQILGDATSFDRLREVEADAAGPGFVLMDNRRQLLHLEPLLVPATDFMNVGDDLVEIVLVRVDDVIAGGHGDGSRG